MKKCILIVFALLISCEINDKSSYEDEYEQALILTYLLKASKTAKQSCIDANNSAYSCLENASGIKDTSAYQPFSETIFTAVMVYPAYLQADTYYVVSPYSSIDEYCDAYITSDSFKDYSDRIIACISDCRKAFWDDRSNNGLCGESAYNQILGSFSFGITSCRIDCLKPTGNEL